MKGIAVSSGSACTSDSLAPSHVLLAMGVPPAIAQGSVRFSLGRDDTAGQVDYVVTELAAIITRLRATPLEVKMVLTAPFCPLAGMITEQVRQAAAAVPGVKEAKVTLRDEPWNPAWMKRCGRCKTD